MYLLVGLGNPGSQYAGTRHNVGFIFLDYLAERHGINFGESKWQAEIARASLWHESLLLLKPQTYMNRSGTSVARAISFFKDQLTTDRIIVIQDDLDLPLGRIKLGIKQGPAGHNGIRSLISDLGTNDFPRVRFGIGRPVVPMPVEHYVLSRFSPGELATVHELLPLIEDGVQLLVEKGVAAAMKFINSRPWGQ